MKTLILTHGRLADELLAAAEMIAGKQDCLEALSLEWSDGSEAIHKKLGPRLDGIDDGSGVLILTDMFGGTPCNVALTFANPGRIEVVTGVNLPMVMRLGCTSAAEDKRDVADVARWLCQKGQQSIRRATDMGGGPPTNRRLQTSTELAAEGGLTNKRAGA